MSCAARAGNRNELHISNPTWRPFQKERHPVRGGIYIDSMYAVRAEIQKIERHPGRAGGYIIAPFAAGAEISK